MPPPIEKYQNGRGTTLLRWRSDAIHWIRKRAEKSAWPRKPMPSHSWSVVMITPSSERPIVDGARGAERYRWRGILRGAAEHGAEDVVGLADVLRTAAARDEREDPLGFLGRHAAVLVADVGEVAQGDLQRDRDAVEAVDGDRLLAALDLADEFPAEPGSLAESLLAERALLSECTKTLTEEFPDVFDG